MEDSSVIQRIAFVLIHAMNLFFLFGIIAACGAFRRVSENTMFSTGTREVLSAKKTAITCTLTSISLWIVTWLMS